MRTTIATLLTLFVMMTPALAADDGATVFEDAYLGVIGKQLGAQSRRFC